LEYTFNKDVRNVQPYFLALHQTSCYKQELTLQRSGAEEWVIFTDGLLTNTKSGEKYRISQPIRRAVIFSLEILEKNNFECILILVRNLLKINMIVTYQN
jgi:hypothetical protein